jgi:hydrogenase maturation protein HypF
VDDPLAFLGARLQEGKIVAVKGLGGYHLSCDALQDEVVRELRRRKHREAKPLAIMETANRPLEET